MLREQEHEILTTTSLTHYYKKTETYNQTEVNNLLADKANKSDVPTKTSQLTMMVLMEQIHLLVKYQLQVVRS